MCGRFAQQPLCMVIGVTIKLRFYLWCRYRVPANEVFIHVESGLERD